MSGRPQQSSPRHLTNSKLDVRVTGNAGGRYDGGITRITDCVTATKVTVAHSGEIRGGSDGEVGEGDDSEIQVSETARLHEGES